MTPSDFWAPWEKNAHSFNGILKIIHEVFDKWSSKGRVFAWRGHANAEWPLYRSLYRRLQWTRGAIAPAEEIDLQKEEARILADMHRWGLHMGNHGRLSVLNQLALLQHYGAPTRLIDITFNPLIGLWFAVQEHWDNGQLINEDQDARLFAIDVTSRLINEDTDRRAWEDNLTRPWPMSGSTQGFRHWTTKVWAWKPSRFDSRIAAQNGGFLLGGVPTTGTTQRPVQWPRSAQNNPGWLRISEVREATSVALRVHKIDPQGGGVSEDAVYTFRIKAKAKQDIRNHLENLYGYRHASIYPDPTGFSLFGTPELKNKP